MMNERRYIYVVERDGRSINRFRIVKTDDVFVTVLRDSHSARVVKLVRVHCAFSEREAWRRYVKIARQQLRSERRWLRAAHRDIRTREHAVRRAERALMYVLTRARKR